MWGQRDYRIYPPQYGDPSIEEEVEVEEDENGSMNDQQKEINRGLGKGISCGNGRGLGQVRTVRTQQDRQEEEWSVPTDIESREDAMERCESSRDPPTPPPSEDRLFTEWSSLDSPTVRTSPRNVSLQDTEQIINQPDNQTVQPGTEPAQVEVEGNILSDDVTTLSTHGQPNHVGTRLMDMGTNTSDIESEISKRWSKSNCLK